MNTFTFLGTQYTLDLPQSIVDMIVADVDFDTIEGACLELDYDEDLDEYTGNYANILTDLYEGTLRPQFA